MSDVPGCSFCVVNGSATNISGNVTHQYHDNSAEEIKVTSLAPGEMSDYMSIKSGTNHTDQWSVSFTNKQRSNYGHGITTHNQRVEVVIGDYGFTVFPSKDSPGVTKYS